ncbi:MAG: hypothetical protein LBL91_00295 [Lachnospiraceae bacterium]|jgi:hypothetical protein|nr:hypothetical protein [Lachnospiraceae bacterium]
MIEEIIRINEKRILKDIDEIDGIKFIDFIDIFPVSEEHKELLDNEAKEIAKIIDKTEKGTFYLLNNGINTKWGKLRFIKIRFFDKTRLNWEAAPDFAVENWEELSSKIKTDNRFSLYKRKEWDAIEYKTDNLLVYFLNPLVTSVYNIKQGE